MLAQNCFANLDIAMKRQAIEAELEKERIEANKKLQTEKNGWRFCLKLNRCYSLY